MACVSRKGITLASASGNGLAASPPDCPPPDLALPDVISDLNARLVARLYDQHGGHYLLREVIGGVYVDIRPLSRDEALTFYCGPRQALLHVYPT